MDQRRRQGQAALHAARDIARQLAAVVPQLHKLEHLAAPAAAAEPAHPVQRRREVDVLLHRQVGIQDEKLRQIADALPHMRLHPVRGLPEHGHRPLRGAIGAVHEADRGGLAAPRRTDEAEDLALVDREIEVLDRGRVAESLGGVLHDDDRTRCFLAGLRSGICRVP